MSGMDRVNQQKQAGASFVLLLCACLLAAHFIAEGLLPVIEPLTAAPVDQPHQPDVDSDSCDDFFVSPAASRLPGEVCVLLPVIEQFSRGIHFIFSPLLPPPDL